MVLFQRPENSIFTADMRRKIAIRAMDGTCVGLRAKMLVDGAN